MKTDNQARGASLQAYPPSTYAAYVVGMLLLIGVVSYLDRNVIALLVDPIKHDLRLSDTEVSFLQGAAYAVFYVAFGLPCGVLVDTVSRRWLLAAGVALWSVMTAAGGFAETYGQLFFARVGVGVGEACLAPAAFSLIADYVPPARRGRAMSVYNMANYLGGGASLLIGGLVLKMLGPAGARLPGLGHIASWKGALIIIGAPGVLLALLALSIREPQRRQLSQRAVRAGRIPRFVDHLREAPMAYAAVYFVSMMTAFAGISFASWTPAFFVRQFGLHPAQAGLLLGPVGVICGPVGCILSGILSDRFVAADLPGGRFLLPLLWWPVGVLGLLITVWAPEVSLATAGYGIFLLGSGLGLSSVAPTIHDITPNEFRGQATAIHFVLSGLLAMGVAPTLVALVSDYVFADPHALGKSMVVILLPISIASFIVCWLTKRPYERARRQGLALAS